MDDERCEECSEECWDCEVWLAFLDYINYVEESKNELDNL